MDTSKGNLSDTQRLLYARLCDMLTQAARGEPVCGKFLSPADAAFARWVMREHNAEDCFLLYGGYEGAEREIPIILPEYARDYPGTAEEKAKSLFADELSVSVSAVRIKGSGYRTLTHRDYLGSLLSLGIERDRLGDIVTEGEFGAVIFCSGSILDFLLSHVDRIASDKVSVSVFVNNGDLKVNREFLPIRDTVASRRLDCAVSALTSLSREKAQALIRSGLCELDYVCHTECDPEIEPPCIISVRGFGKYNILSFDGETRRGRLRLVAQKYV